MADRVASGLVARDNQQDEKRGHLGGGEPLAVEFGLHQAGGQIVAGCAPPVVGKRGGVRTDVHRYLVELVEVRGDVGIAETQNDVRPVEDPLVVGFGNAHQVADDLQGERTGQIGDDLALAVGMILQHRGHKAAGPVAHRILEEGQHTRGERAADDVAQPGVARIVHRDHRAEVLGQLGGLVADGDPTRGAEDLGVPAGVEHVVVAGHRPMAGSRGELLADERLVERHRSLSAQGGERAVTYVVVEPPEVPRREVDVRQRNLGRNGAVHPGRDTHVASLRVSFVTGPALGPSLLLHLGLEHVARACCNSSRTDRSCSRKTDQ